MRENEPEPHGTGTARLWRGAEYRTRCLSEKPAPRPPTFACTHATPRFLLSLLHHAGPDNLDKNKLPTGRHRAVTTGQGLQSYVHTCFGQSLSCMTLRRCQVSQSLLLFIVYFSSYILSFSVHHSTPARPRASLRASHSSSARPVPRKKTRPN